MLDMIKKNNSMKLGLSLVIVTVLFVCIQNVGVLPKICNAVEKIGLNVTGYEAKVYVINTASINPVPIAMMMGVNLEQEIHLTEKVISCDEIMLEIDVANYDRINEGQMVVEIHQDDVVKVFVTEMSRITKNKTLRLITDTQGFQKGDIIVNIYAPEATGENCIAVYSVNNTKAYSELVVCGEKTESNACIDLAVPSDFAKSDFTQVNVE